MTRSKKMHPTKRIRTYRNLNRIKIYRSKNVLRGIITDSKQSSSPLVHVNKIRSEISPADLTVAAELLIGSEGLYPIHYIPKDYQAIQSFHKLETVSSHHETAFICGHLNGWKAKCLELLSDMKIVIEIDQSLPLDQLRSMKLFYDKWGISDFLNKKLVYYMNLAEVDKSVVAEYRAFTQTLNIEAAPEPYFSAMELMSERYPYFRSIRTWTDMLRKYKTNDFRQHNALHNALPVPIEHKDVGSYLRKCFSMSIPDELCALKIIISLKSEWQDLANCVKQNLDPQLFSALMDLENPEYSHGRITDQFPDEDWAFLLYRRAQAFLEQPELVKYRYDIDRVLASRLLPSRYGFFYKTRSSSSDKMALRRSILSSDVRTSPYQVWPLDKPSESFIRTVDFLTYIAEFPKNMDFTEEEIRFIFERTTSLQYLMSERELDALYHLSSDSGKIMVSTLALALYKERQHDEDVDFKFRYTLQMAIIGSFGGSLPNFIKWLSDQNPSIAQFLANTLDRQTIQKLYLLVESAEQADALRQDILRQLGEKLDYLPYLIEADRIRAHNQISKLKTDIDDSRVYVDGIALKKWVRENPNAYIKEYRRLIEHSIETLTRAAVVISDTNISIVKAEISVIASFDYILTRAMETVFLQFCINHSFGIDSYLGRRIRHNTLHGMMLGGVDSIIERFPALYADAEYMEVYNRWLELYKRTIDFLRLEILQFRSDSKKRGIFVSSFDTEGQLTSTNIGELRKSIMFSGVLDNFEDAVLRFCWDQFEPQLKSAQRYISRELRSTEIERIDGIFGTDPSAESRRFVAQLRDSVHDRFVTLSSWFQVPEDRTLSATIAQISNLITIECERAIERSLEPVEWLGHDTNLTIKGSSVHRLYDCLFVVIYNAYRHGSKTSKVRATVSRILEQRNSILKIEITSDFADERKREEQIARIQEVLDQANNLSTAMIKEGYSGIRKLLYLTSDGKGPHSVDFSHNENSLNISFKTAVEVEDGSFEDLAS